MNTKKFFILSVLILLAIMSFTGCGTKSITEEYENAKDIAYNFLNTKDYEVPKEYTVSFEGQNREKLIVKCNNSTKVTFNVTSNNKCELSSLYYLEECQITQENIKTANKLINVFLNTKDFTVSKDSYDTYEINYRKNNEDLIDIKISNINKTDSIIMTYDITYKEPQIVELTYSTDVSTSYQLEDNIVIIITTFVCLIVLLIVISAIVHHFFMDDHS